MIIKRILYLGYYFRELNWQKVDRFMNQAASVSGKSRAAIWCDAIFSSLKYNISILDYFHFHYYQLSARERSQYAGTGFMYEYQLKMNPKGVRDVLENKIEFLQTFRNYVNRKTASLAILESDDSLVREFLSSASNRLVLKGSRGQVGAEVKVIKCDQYNEKTLIDFMKANKLDLLEEYVVQHPHLMKLSPSGLNTVRIFTQLVDGKVEYLGARLRVTINSEIDNMAAGNIAAPIDIATGQVSGPGVFSDITKSPLSVHPVTGQQIVGFQVPFWQETLAMMEKAVRVAPQNKSVGWDIAISEKGPELIEGNHNWCKLLWQMPVNRGMKSELLKYL